MKPRSLLTQVLAVNLLLVAGTVLIATIAVDADLGRAIHGREAWALAVALAATLLGNWLLLRRRFAPLERIVSAMERIDLSKPGDPLRGQPLPRGSSAEVRRLVGAFDRMSSRLESERRVAAQAVIAAQERERRRIAQDLHDEVNQALTAVNLRLQASIEQAPPALARELNETKRLSARAMQELLALARQLRPAVLDDHGLLAALQSQVREFGEQTGIRASFRTAGALAPLSPEQQLAIYRVTQESLSNIARHSGASRVDVELSFVGRTILAITDDGQGFSEPRSGGLGLSGMRERALLAGGQLRVHSSPGAGTRVELSI